MASKRGKTKEVRHSVNFWQALRDVLIASLSKGQFIPACIFFLLIAGIMRMPEQDVSKLLFEIISDLKEGWIIGDVFALILALGWFSHARWQRRTFAKEIKRISDERNVYQREKLGDDFTQSSE